MGEKKINLPRVVFEVLDFKERRGQEIFKN